MERWAPPRPPTPSWCSTTTASAARTRSFSSRASTAATVKNWSARARGCARPVSSSRTFPKSTLASTIVSSSMRRSSSPRRRWSSSWTSWTNAASPSSAMACAPIFRATSSRAATGCWPGQTPSRRSKPSAGAAARPPATPAWQTARWSRPASRSSLAATKATSLSAAGTGKTANWPRRRSAASPPASANTCRFCSTPTPARR